MLAIVVKFFVLSECVSVLFLSVCYSFSLWATCLKINDDDDDDDLPKIDSNQEIEHKQ